jgi:KDO2-lipid IV(A) lauroyltransferase
MRALDKGRGVLFFSGHFSNWELMAAAAALLIKPAGVIYRTLDNALLEHLVLRIRSATGNTLIPKEHAMRSMIRRLNRNEIIGILIDQNMAWSEGVFVDYFGRPACTTDGLALLALHTHAPVLPGYIVRLQDGRYRLVIGPEVDVITNTQRFTKIFEETVRRYPDQWFWVHHRWKTQRCQIRMK